MADVAPAIVRGSPNRRTNFQEMLQTGYIHAVAAAAGCNVKTYLIDEGIDLGLEHRASSHLHGRADLEIQLKATTVGGRSDFVTARVSRDRYDEYRHPEPTIHPIVVIMEMPTEQADWIRSTPEALLVHHRAYWVSLRGFDAVSGNDVTVRAPRENVFDDLALCEIMQRIGQGGAP